MDYKIEKNISIIVNANARRRKYPFDKMEVGDSFKLNRSNKIRCACAAYQYGRRKDKKFTVRNIDDEHCRCWRIE